jgi:hypothetical protein
MLSAVSFSSIYTLLSLKKKETIVSLSRKDLKQLHNNEKVKLNYITENENIIFELNNIYNNISKQQEKHQYKKLLN